MSEYRELAHSMSGICAGSDVLEVYFAAMWIVAMAIFKFPDRQVRGLLVQEAIEILAEISDAEDDG
jgi:hypothetical protein